MSKNSTTRPSPPIKGIIFDNGDILFDAAVWRRWLAKYLQQEVKDLTYDQLVNTWERLLIDVYRGEAEYWDRFQLMLEEFEIAANRIDSVVALAKSKGQEFQADRKPMPGVPLTLQQLKKQGIKLAVLSDTESGEQGVRRILSQLQIEPYFDAVVASRDIGVVKPDPAAFEFAACQIDTNVSHCAFVGHDIDELEGAIACGMHAIAYNYHPDAPADTYISEFSELAEMKIIQTGHQTAG